MTDPIFVEETLNELYRALKHKAHAKFMQTDLIFTAALKQYKQ